MPSCFFPSGKETISGIPSPEAVIEPVPTGHRWFCGLGMLKVGSFWFPFTSNMIPSQNKNQLLVFLRSVDLPWVRRFLEGWFVSLP